MNKKKNIFFALLVMLLWGSLFPAVKLGYAAYDIITMGDILFFAGTRFTVCGFVITLYCFINKRGSFKAVKALIVPVLMSGVFAVILHYGFTYMGLKLTDSSKTAILKQVGVLFYVCFAGLYFKDDKITPRKMIGVLAGFAGIIAINFSNNKLTLHLGDVFIILASFCTVFSNVISKRVFKTVEPITATGISQLFGGVVLLVVGFFMGGRFKMGINFDMLIFVYICIASVISYCMWYVIVKDGQLSKLFIVKFAEPVFATLFGAVILGENIFKIQYFAAFLLIAGGIYISNSTQ